MNVCKVSIEQKDQTIEELKIFNSTLELNYYVDSLIQQKSMGAIIDYTIESIKEVDLYGMNTYELLSTMPFESFIKLIKSSLKDSESTIKTF